MYRQHYAAPQPGTRLLSSPSYEPLPLTMRINTVFAKLRRPRNSSVPTAPARQRADMDGSLPAPTPLEDQQLRHLGLMAAGIAHDFNNVLTVLLGNAELALLDLEPTSPAYVQLDQIRHGLHHASGLAQLLLAYVGKRGRAVEPTDIGALAAELAQLLNASIPPTTTLHLCLDPQTPTVEVDATQIRRVVLNLILNAVEAIGNTAGTITLTTQIVQADRAYLATMDLGADLPAGPYVALTIADTGCGMDDATRARIGELRFTTKDAGYGLGLAVVQEIVRTYQGALHIKSALGSGTTITILFPVSTYDT